MHANPICSSESVVIDTEGEAEDDQEVAPIKKKNVYGIVLMRNLKGRSLLNCHPSKTKMSKNHCTAM